MYFPENFMLAFLYLLMYHRKLAFEQTNFVETITVIIRSFPILTEDNFTTETMTDYTETQA